MARIGGMFYIKINGKLYQAGDGEFSFNVGGLKREAKLSSAGVAGFIAKPQVPYCEGELLLTGDLNINEILSAENSTITLELYNGKTFALYDAYFAGEGEINTEGVIKVRFEGLKGELING